MCPVLGEGASRSAVRVQVSVAGAYAAPLLVSSGGGNVIALFSDHLLLGVAYATVVIPARLHGTKATGGAVELFLLRPVSGARPSAFENADSS